MFDTEKLFSNVIKLIQSLTITNKVWNISRIFPHSYHLVNIISYHLSQSASKSAPTVIISNMEIKFTFTVEQTKTEAQNQGNKNVHFNFALLMRYYIIFLKRHNSHFSHQHSHISNFTTIVYINKLKFIDWLLL